MTRPAFKAAWSVVFLLAGCSSSGGASDEPVGGLPGDAGSGATPVDSGAPSNYPGADLGMKPVAAGLVRYETHPITVPAGQDVMWEEWVAAPLDGDMDVVSVDGLQGQGGHHANLYATTDLQPVGTSHAWKDADQLTTRSLGGIGGEGNSAIVLPPGVVFRVSKGSALMIQSHFLNAGTTPIQGISVLDIKLTAVDPTAKVASVFSNVTTKFSIPPGGRATADFKCVMQANIPALMYANHMHNWGVSASTELIASDGTTKPLQVDPVWDPSWAFHANYTKFTAQSPGVIPAGSTLHTTCTWANSGTTAINFPDEMCIFGVIFVGDKDATCADGTWR